MAVASVVLKTIREYKSKTDPERGYGMWIIMYYDPDTRLHTKVPVKLVCGEFYPMNGERRYVAKGMTTRDFEAFRDHYADLKRLEKSPPPIPAPEAAAPPPPPPAPTIEDCPF
jgi:hypothetical protein